MKIRKIFRYMGVALSVLGAAGILITRRVFDVNVKEYIKTAGEVPMAKDNFNLFFTLSVALCALLLALIFTSLAVNAVGGRTKISFGNILLKIYSPLSMAVIIAMSVFFSYLSADKLFSAGAYIISLGICEAALFALPMAVCSLTDEKLHEKRTDDKKGS